MLGDWTRVESIMVWSEKETCVRRLNVELRYVSSRLFHTITTGYRTAVITADVGAKGGPAVYALEPNCFLFFFYFKWYFIA